MIFNSFFTQIVMAALAVGIIFVYVQPTFTSIGLIQESITQYQEETSKVSEVNARLSSLVSKINSISASDMKALLTYIPDEVDEVAVSRELLIMSEEAGAYLESIKYEETVPIPAMVNESSVEVVRHSFSLSLIGTYVQTKTFLTFLEQNNYPLEISKMSIISSETGIITSDIEIITYSHN